MASSLAVANEFILRSAKTGGLSHMQLQKLVYLTHGWWLTFHDDPIVSESPQVWQFGPVFPFLYRILRDFKKSKIIEAQDAPLNMEIDPVPEGEAQKAIDWIWEKYGHMTGPALSDRTHEIGSPWHQIAVKHKFSVPFGTTIPIDLIKDYYRSEAEALAGRL